MNNAILRSYQVFGADDQVLTAAAEAVKKAVKDAKSKGSVQKVSLTRRGYRHDIEVGDIFVVPTSVCDDPADFPTILLDANLRQHTTGEGMVEFQMGALADPKELSRDALQAFKAVAFKNSKGDFAPLIVFAAAWAHPSAYQSFAYDEDTLFAMLRDVAYASPFNPSLSSVFDQLQAVDKDSAPYTKVAPVTQHIFSIPKSKDPVYPTFAKGLEIAGDEGGKKASLEHRDVVRLRRTAADIPETTSDELTGDEINLFQDLGAELGTMVKTTDPKQAATYVDPMPMQGEMGLRAQPDYGAPDSKEQIHPAMVDGPDPKLASEDEKVQVTGLVPQTPTEVENKAPEGAEAAGAATVKEAAFAQDTVQCCNKFVEHWAGRLLNGAQLKKELGAFTDKLKDAVVFLKDQGLLSQESANLFKVKNRDMVADDKLPKQSYVLRHAHDNRVWAAQEEGGLLFGGEWTEDRTAAYRFASLKTLSEEARRHMLGKEAKVAVKFCKCDGDCECSEASGEKLAKLAGWWSPGAVVEQFYPELLHKQVDSPFMEQTESPNLINPFGAPGKEQATDISGLGLSQDVDSTQGVPLRTEMNFYGPEYARNFYAPHADITPGALKAKKPLAASDKKANPALLAAPAIAEAAAPAAAAAAAPAAAGAGAGSGSALGAVTQALSMMPPPAPAEDKQASHKKADGALALFQGLSVATPEEHPQAHFDETAPDGQPGEYVEPTKEDAVPQDATFVSLDAFLKGVVAAYAAQLIGAFKATGRPLALSAPYSDTLDLVAALEFAGNFSTPEAISSAKAQFTQALSNMNDDQRKMLLDNAVSQAAVWCPNTQGSGGFNYEVFVRAEKLDGTTLTVRVVTGSR